MNDMPEPKYDDNGFVTNWDCLHDWQVRNSEIVRRDLGNAKYHGRSNEDFLKNLAARLMVANRDLRRANSDLEIAMPRMFHLRDGRRFRADVRDAFVPLCETILDRPPDFRADVRYTDVTPAKEHSNEGS